MSDCRFIHRLPILSFNGCSNDEKEISTEMMLKSNSVHASNKKFKYKRCRNGNVRDLQNLQTKISSNINFQRRTSTIKSFHHSLKKPSLNEPRCFKNKRSTSFESLKQKISSNYIVFSDYVKQKVHSLVEHKNNQDRKYCKDTNDIQVLFTSKPIKKIRKRNMFEQSRKYNNMCFYSKSSDVVFGFHSENQNYPKCYNLNTNHCNNCLKKQTTPHTTHNWSYRNGKKLVHNNISQAHSSLPVVAHYNLVDFPQQKIINREFNQRQRKNCINKATVLNVHALLDQEVSVTPSSFPLYKKTTGDSFSDVNIANINKKLNKNKRSRRGKDSKAQKTFVVFPSLHLGHSFFILTKNIFKYVLLILAVVAWSPCIISVWIYWLVTYLLHPPYIVTNSTRHPCGSCMKCSLKYFWHSLFHSLFCMSKRICTTCNALNNFLKKNKDDSQHLKSSFFQSINNQTRRIHPNPKNKYTFYFKSHRGWLVKPVKRCQTDSILNKNFKTPEKPHGKGTYYRFQNNRIYKTKSTLATTPGIRNETRVKGMARKRSHNLLPPNRFYTKSLTNLLSYKEGTLTIPKCKVEGELNRQFTPLIGSTKNITHKKNMANNDVSTQKNSQNCRNIVDFHYDENNFRCFDKNAHFHVQQRPKNINNICSKTKSKNLCFCRYRMPFHSHHIKQCVYHKKSFRNSTRSKYPIVYVSKNNRSQCLKCSQCTCKCKKQKILFWCKTLHRNIKNVIRDAEHQVWTTNICNDMYIQSLQKIPCFWIYRCCPSAYPCFLLCYRFYENFVFCILFVLASCIWCPLLCWCYLCYSIFCNCFT